MNVEQVMQRSSALLRHDPVSECFELLTTGETDSRVGNVTDGQPHEELDENRTQSMSSVSS